MLIIHERNKGRRREVYQTAGFYTNNVCMWSLLLASV